MPLRGQRNEHAHLTRSWNMARSWWLVLLIAACGCQASEASPETAAATAVATATTSTAPTRATGTASASTKAPEPPKPVAPPEGMVKIPAGVFLMGANAALGNPEERPAHEGIVPAFFMDTHEVTVDAFKKCVAAGKCEPAHENYRFCNAKFKDRGDHPISCVNLHMAKAYCEFAGGRLPTEREWEYAASGGLERRRYSWGNASPTNKICCYEHPYGSCQVGSFDAGAFGLYDMTGNAWEWVLSEFAKYPSKDQPDEIDPEKLYVYRGGSWSRRFPKWMRAMLRNRWKADRYSGSLGMRCIKPITPLECPKDTSDKDGACVRTTGTPVCEPAYVYDAEKKNCEPDFKAGGIPQPKNWRQGNQVTNPEGIGTPDHGEGAEKVAATITRSRTAKHDPDCARHWPAYPNAYLFKGGDNYPSRKPTVKASGCVARDMGWSWTSACCK